MTRNNARLTDLKNERKSNEMKLQNIPLVIFLVNLYHSKFPLSRFELLSHSRFW